MQYLNDLVHSVCALVIYLFWWTKPLDVEQPVLIEGEQAEQMLAFFWMTTNGFPVAYRGGNNRRAEVCYLSVDSDRQLPTEQAHEGPGDKVAKSGSYFYRPSMRDELSKMLPKFVPAEITPG